MSFTNIEELLQTSSKLRVHIITSKNTILLTLDGNRSIQYALRGFTNMQISSMGSQTQYYSIPVVSIFWGGAKRFNMLWGCTHMIH